MTPSVKNILEAVAYIREVSVDDLLSSGRGPKSLSAARQEAYFFIGLILNKSLSEIGEVFSNRDHTTIMHGCASVERKLGLSLEYTHEMARIRNLIDKGAIQKPNPNVAIEDIDPSSVALRIVASVVDTGEAQTNGYEVVAMAYSLDKAYDALTGLCGRKNITDDDLQPLFDAFHNPLKVQEEPLQ